jgi:hypothetical protein
VFRVGGRPEAAQVAVAYEVGGLFTAPAGVFELQAVHESTKPPMVLVMRLLGSDSIGKTIDLGLLRGGTPTTLKVVIGERPVA